jgi:hypothetical protein
LTTFFVSPPADTSWALSPVSVAERLQADWPDVEVRTIPADSGRSVSLEYSGAVDGEEVHGSLDRRGQALVVVASPSAAALMIAWFRGLVADEQDLIAYDEALEDSMPVPPGTSAQAVAAVFG